MSGNSDPCTPRDKIEKSKGTSPCSNGSNGGWTPGPVSPSPPGAEWPPEKDKPDTGAERHISFEPQLWMQPCSDGDQSPGPFRGLPAADMLPSELPPIPVLEPIPADPPELLAPLCNIDIIAEEAQERQRIVSCMLPRRSLMHTLVVAYHHDTVLLQSLLPDGLWDHDNSRLALGLYVTKGDFAMVEWVLQATSFRDFSRVRVKSAVRGTLGVDTRLLEEHGVSVPPHCETFVSLALMCCKEAMDSNDGSVDERAEILKLILQSRYACFSKVDEHALRSVRCHSAYRTYTQVSGVVDFWLPFLYSHSRCVLAPCCIDECADAGLYTHMAALSVKWKPSNHLYFNKQFRRRVALVIKKLRKHSCMTTALLAHVVQAMEWDQSPKVPAPHKVCVVVHGVEYDGCHRSVRQFNKQLACGSKISAKIGSTTRTCTVVGCKEVAGDLQLYVMSMGKAVPLVKLADSRSMTVEYASDICLRAHLVWWCDECQRLVPGQWCWQCNTRYGARPTPSDPPPLVELAPPSLVPTTPPASATPPELPSLVSPNFVKYFSYHSPPRERDTSFPVFTTYGVHRGQSPTALVAS
eukprot:TRINITY_DN29812_c0_g1_i1.p1 TRINITY_DN29812_c0_g1~~TRINITY_DN29812_c0_g1_i1.p1  ORF type:complete len:580 (+),score=75.25 TRINITY_DN29812_c0_g1_i1:42-1781(+)